MGPFEFEYLLIAAFYAALVCAQGAVRVSGVEAAFVCVCVCVCVYSCVNNVCVCMCECVNVRVCVYV